MLYEIALSLLPDVGAIKAKSLLAYCGSAEAVFKATKTELEKIPGIGTLTAVSIRKSKVLERAESELKYCRREKIEILFYTHPDYPYRLKQCEDGPLLLYYKGKAPLNYSRIIAVVGSRNATDQGKANCEQLIAGLKELNVMVVSGLAYGIDVCAHRACLKSEIPTLAVLAHGLDSLYPSQHRSIAEKMCEQGGLLTEFPSETHLHPDFFPRRNRIIAGISDAVLVVEATMRSGSLVTAILANDYNRDVFAVPGRLTDTSSEGCNHLIKSNKASLLQSVKDIEYLMGWEKSGKEEGTQLPLFRELDPEEEQIVQLLRKETLIHIDEICERIQMPSGKILSILLNLEFDGIVKSKPGKQFSIAG